MIEQKYFTLPQKLVTSYQSKISNVQCIVKKLHKFQAHWNKKDIWKLWDGIRTSSWRWTHRHMKIHKLKEKDQIVHLKWNQIDA
jgi:hypothetical protein